jgi:tetratricopeptide (TPR) repeat protein
MLGQALTERGRSSDLWRRAQRRYPRNFWVNALLGASMMVPSQGNQAALMEAAGYLRVALAVRPQSPHTQLLLGRCLRAAQQLSEAEDAFRKTIALIPVASVGHQELGHTLSLQKKYDEAIACCRKAIALDPKDANAHNNLGRALYGKGKLDEAIACHRKAIALDPKDARAQSNLGNLLANVKRDYNGAIACFSRAIEIDPKYANAHNGLGAILCDIKRDYDGAIASFKRAIAITPKDAEVHCNLGNALRGKGKWDEAIACYRRAIAIDPKHAHAHYNLGLALHRKDRLDEAIDEYQEAIRLNPDYPEAHCNLGDILLNRGQFKDAVNAIRRGHELGSRNQGWRYPSAQWLRRAEQAAELDDRLSAVLKGKAQPKDATECFAFAQFCQQFRKRYVAAVRFYAEAFVAQPGLAQDPTSGHRYNAACAAALAGCGQGKDAAAVTPMQWLHWRRQALTWLRADLTVWNKLLKKGADKARPIIVQTMRHWQTDSDFAGVRGPQALARLPEAERPAWQKLWADVDDTLARARKKPIPEGKSGTK